MTKVANLCAMCKRPAIGTGRFPYSRRIIGICMVHKDKVADFKPYQKSRWIEEEDEVSRRK